MSALRLVGRLTAVCIIFVFVIVSPALILAYDAQQAAVDGDFLDELFDDTVIFEEAIPEMAQDLARETPRDHDTRDMPIAQLDADDWERIINAIAPPEDMQDWAQQGLDGFHDWTRRGRGRFLEDVILPYGDIRDNMVNDPEQTVLRTLTEALPVCSGGQEPMGGPDSLIPQCRPSESRLDDFYQRVGQEWSEQPRQVWRQLWPDELARYPDNISLAELIEEESDEEVWDEQVNWRLGRWGLRAAQWLLALCIMGLCVVPLGVAALFAARNWREALRWVGSPVALVGLLTLLLAFFFLVGGEFGVMFFDEDVPIGVQNVLEDTARAFARDLWRSLAWQGGVLLLIGLGMWALSFAVPVYDDWEPAPVAPEDKGARDEETEDAGMEDEGGEDKGAQDEEATEPEGA